MKPSQSKIKQHAKSYVKVIEWDPADGCFVGSAPPIIGPACHGATEAEVLRRLGPIVEEWVEMFLAEGIPLPGATANREYSGKFLVRLGPELHKKAAVHAMVRGQSLNHYVVETLENEYLARESQARYGSVGTRKRRRS
jgi:predicted HicB family RNase H-like nuclease